MIDEPLALGPRLAGNPLLPVGILLFSGVEVLDFAGPFEVFSVAARIAARTLEAGPGPFKVLTVGTSTEPVIARHGLSVIPERSFDDVPPLDVLIVPGGIVDDPLADSRTLAWLRRTSGQAIVTASVCTGAFLLARIGLLDGLSATTHWEDVADLRARFPAVSVVDGVTFVDQGHVVTSAGIAAGISMSLHLVARLVGPELAKRTARQMQYDWTDEFLEGGD